MLTNGGQSDDDAECLLPSVEYPLLEKIPFSRRRIMAILNNNKPVWIRDNEHGFILGKIIDIGTDLITVQFGENQQVRE